MKITKVELLNYGADGLKITGTTIQYSEDSGVTLRKPTIQTYPLSVPRYVITAWAKLKFPFLVLSRHWSADFGDIVMNEDQDALVPYKDINTDNKQKWYAGLSDTWEHCYITAIEIGPDRDKFRLSGEIRTIGNKYIKVKSPWITESMDWDLYDTCVQDISEAYNAVNKLNNTFAQKSLSVADIKDMYPEKYAEIAKQVEGDDPNDPDVEARLVANLESKGFLILSPSDSGAVAALPDSEKNPDLPIEEVTDFPEAGKDTGEAAEEKSDTDTNSDKQDSEEIPENSPNKQDDGSGDPDVDSPEFKDADFADFE